MQLRTIKKPKRKDDDIGYEYQQPQTQKKHHQQKPHNEKEGHSSNENSNLTNDNEATNRHKLRNACSNYQGKYKKMNSGKYLYKLPSEEKKVPIPKKRQLQHIPNDLANQFKKFVSFLFKKEEESFLNKKKKREEGKTKAKADKPKYQGRPPQQIPQYQPQGNLHPMQYPPMDYLNGYFPKGYPGQASGYQIQGPPGQYMFFTTNTPYQMYPFNHCIEQKDLNEITLDYFSKKSVVNHIVGAYYIYHVQQEKDKEKEKKLDYKKIVPVNMVKLSESIDETDTIKKEETKTEIPAKVNQEHTQEQNELQYQQDSNQSNNQGKDNQKPTMTSTTTIQQSILMDNLISDNFNDLGATREQQLTKVNNVINSIKENKIDEIIDKNLH